MVVFSNWFHVFGQNRGAVSVIAAIALPIVVGIAGLAVEYGHGVLEKVENQRVADSSAYAGAIAYNSTASLTAMTSAVQAVAAMNGISPNQVSAALVASPTGTASTNAVRVIITTSVPLLLSRIIESASALPVVSSSYAELRPMLSACILAFSASGTGITLTGGTQLQAPACAVASNTGVSVPCGTTLQTVGVDYNSAAVPSSPCGGLTGPSGTTPTIAKKASIDPLANNPDITTARNRLATLTSLAVPATPTIPAAPLPPVVATPSGPFTDITFDIYNNGGTTTKTQATALGCTATATGSTWTFSCAAGTHRINSLAVAGGQSVGFSGSTSTNYVFAQPVNMGAAIDFGAGNFTFMQGLTVGYGGVNFGAGSLSVIGALMTGGSGGTATIASTNVVVTGNVSFTSTTTLSGTGTLSIGASLNTNGTTNISQSSINVVGNAALTSSTTLSGTGKLAVGGSLTTSDNLQILLSTISVTGTFSVKSAVAFNNLTTLAVGGLTNLGTSGTMSFAGGSYSLAGGLSTSGSTVVSIGAGTYTIGRIAVACNGAQFSICSNAASTIFTGPSVFKLNAGVSVGGGSTLVLGNSGTANSFSIGTSTNGNAIQVAGGSTFRMGDATGNGSVFELGGNLNIASGGGSCTVIAAAIQHDINGSILTAGATILGAGNYSVYGSVGIGVNGGGNVMCNGATTGLLATGVSLIIGGNGAALTGTCAGQSFCVAAGYSSVVLSAPTAGTYQRMAIVGPASGGGAYFTGGASGTTLSGLVYFPASSIRLDGAANVGNGAGECLQLIGKDVTLNGGSLLASTCISGNASGSRVVLVQ